MAKIMGGFNARNVRQWFSGLDFVSKKALLDELSASFEEAKAGRVLELKAEIESLGGGVVSAKPKAVRKGAVSVGAGKKRGTKPGTKVPPKYIDKVTGKTWAGRGVQPAWVVAHVKKGGKVEDLLIAKKRR